MSESKATHTVQIRISVHLSRPLQVSPYHANPSTVHLLRTLILLNSVQYFSVVAVTIFFCTTESFVQNEH